MLAMLPTGLTALQWVSEDVKKHISYETYDSSYSLQNVWANEMFCKKVNQLQLAMLIRVTYLLLSIYHILNM